MTGTSPDGVEVLEYTYTSRDEIDSIFSELGVTLRLEDQYSSKGPGPYLDDIIEDATDTVNQYCEWRYYPEDMATNKWVRRRASKIAAHALAQRRGNPKQFTTMYEQVMADLEGVFASQVLIPRLNIRSIHKPDYNNLVVEDRNRESLPGGGTWYTSHYWYGPF